MKLCPHCQTAMSLKARYCPNCGAEQIEAEEAPLEYILLDIDQPVAGQFSGQFFLALKQRIQEEHGGENYLAFSERVYESGFRDTIAQQAQVLQEAINQLDAQGRADYRKINRAAKLQLEDLLDAFIIQFCPDLTQVQLPDAILKHHSAQATKSELKTLIMDYLDLDQENERSYTNRADVPLEGLKNARTTYLFPNRDEVFYLLVDTSITGNGKTGFAMTDQALYWKVPFQKARQVNYQQIESVVMEKNWLLINQQFFNVNSSLNLKVLKLLKKIRQWGY